MVKQISVGIADMKMTRQEGVLITYALGSCIGISFYDPMIKLGALLHIMLPQQSLGNDSAVFKFADSGIKETLKKFAIFGGSKQRCICKIAGGAKMFEMSANSTLGNIGERNALMVKQVLRAEGIRISGEDTGANYARTMFLDVATGQVGIRTTGKPERML